MNIIEKISELDITQRRKLIERIKNNGKEYGIFQLTKSQEIFWKKHRLNQPLLLIGNIRFIVKFTPADVEKVKWLINELRSIHDVCRYRFVEIDGEVFQYIDNDTKPNIAVYNTDLDNQKKIEECYVDFFEKDFELDSDFAIVFGIVKTDDDSCRLMIKMHHIVADGFSIGVIIRDIYKILNGISEKCKIQFQDYVESINEKSVPDTAYWIEKIRKADKRLDPPLDKKRYSNDRDGSERFVLEQIKGNDFLNLRELVKSIKHNFFNVGSSLFSMLLQRWANKDNMIMSSTFFNRVGEEAADIIGNFSSFLPLLYCYDGNMNFNEYITHNTEEFREAMAHGNVANMSLQEAYPYECCSGYMPIYQVIFAYHSKNIYSSITGNAGGVNIELEDYNFNTLLKNMCTDIVVRIEELEDMYSIAVGYNKKFFDEQSIKQIVGIFKNMLIDLSKLIETRLDDVVLADYSNIPLCDRIFSAAPAAHEKVDINISNDYVITDSEGTAVCILDKRMKPVPVNFCGRIFVRKDDEWYSTGKAGRITFGRELLIDEESSELRCINGTEFNLFEAAEKLENIYKGINVRFYVSDDEMLLITYCGINEKLTKSMAAEIIGIEPVYVHRSERLNQKSFSNYITKISGIVSVLKKNGFEVDVEQRDDDERVMVIINGESRPDDSFIDEIRNSYSDDRIDFCFSRNTEKYAYPAYVINETQKRICKVWKEITGISDFGIYDDFYETGNVKVGDLVFRLRDMTDKEMGIMTLFEYPNIVRMSEYIDERTDL